MNGRCNRWSAPLVAGLAMLALGSGCELELFKPYHELPPVDQQRALVENGDLKIWMIASGAVFDVWGFPTYERREQTQFFQLENGGYVPRFRVPLGETPPGWGSNVLHGQGHFLAYADRGEMLGFYDDRLVYRERLAPEKIHEIGTVWKREDTFKLDLEKQQMPMP